MAQKKQVSRLKDLKKSKKCSQYQMYDSRLKKCVEVKGRPLPFMIGKGGYNVDFGFEGMDIESKRLKRKKAIKKPKKNK